MGKTYQEDFSHEVTRRKHEEKKRDRFYKIEQD